ncbi:hypothetical protein AAMO2058_001388300 [Amorphochlora amoebiformis]
MGIILNDGTKVAGFGGIRDLESPEDTCPGLMGGSQSRIDDGCKDLQERYDKCHTSWYRDEFLKGKSVTISGECRSLWDAYTSCVKKNVAAKFNIKFEEEEEDDDE